MQDQPPQKNKKFTKNTNCYLNEHLPQKGHDEGWVHAAEAADCADGQLSNLKHFIVQCHKKSLQVLSLCQVGVEAFIQGR